MKTITPYPANVKTKLMISILSFIGWGIVSLFVVSNSFLVVFAIKELKRNRKRKYQRYNWQPMDWRVQADPEFNEHNNQRP